MSLMDSIKEHYDSEHYPPEGPDLDYVQDADGKWVKGDTETELVSEEDHGELRWGTTFINVYKRGDEYVAVQDVRPATEMQGWGDYGAPDIYAVTPRTETIVKTFYDKAE
jgi:hypothetical protein